MLEAGDVLSDSSASDSDGEKHGHKCKQICELENNSDVTTETSSSDSDVSNEPL